MSVITITPGAAGLADWRAIAAGAALQLESGAREAVDAAAQTVETLIASGETVYGLNTGFGKLAHTRIAPDALSQLQTRLVRSHAVGLGDPLPDRVVRLAMGLKIASLARGASGVRWETLDLLRAMLERGVLPLIPGQGSVGASGDLAPLAHMVMAMMGEGKVRVDGEIRAAGPALQAAGLTPARLGPKEGLALLNGTQISTALALTGLFELETCWRNAMIAGAMSLDAAKGSVAPFDPRIHALRGQPGQIIAAAGYLDLLEGSEILASHEACEKVQDPYCLRCQPQVMGAALDLMRQAAGVLAIEANAVTDNPLVFTAEGEAISGGNFHAEPVAFAADQLALAAAEIGALSERRIALLTDPTQSGLPAFLSPDPGLNSGMMITHVTAAALVSENKQLAHPASVDSIPTSANQEDHVSMATHGARRLLAMSRNLAGVIGVELMAAAQGLEFHAPLRTSPRLSGALAAWRRIAPPLQDDRFMGEELAAAQGLVLAAPLDEGLPGLAEGVA